MYNLEQDVESKHEIDRMINQDLQEVFTILKSETDLSDNLQIKLETIIHSMDLKVRNMIDVLKQSKHQSIDSKLSILEKRYLINKK